MTSFIWIKYALKKCWNRHFGISMVFYEQKLFVSKMFPILRHRKSLNTLSKFIPGIIDNYLDIYLCMHNQYCQFQRHTTSLYHVSCLRYNISAQIYLLMLIIGYSFKPPTQPSMDYVLCLMFITLLEIIWKSWWVGTSININRHQQIKSYPPTYYVSCLRYTI